MGREAMVRNKRKYIRHKKRGRKKKEGEAVQSTGRGGRWKEWGQPKVNLIQHGILSCCCRWELGSFQINLNRQVAWYAFRLNWDFLPTFDLKKQFHLS